MWVSLSDIAPTTPFGCFHMYYDQQSWQSTVFFIQVYFDADFFMQSWQCSHLQWHEFSLGSDHWGPWSSICSHTWLCLCWLEGLAVGLLWGATLPARPGERRTWQFCERDLFGMVKTWRFQGLSDLQLGDQKVTLKNWIAWHMVMFIYDSCHWITNDILWYF